MNNILALTIVANHWSLTITPLKWYVGKIKSEHECFEFNSRVKAGKAYKFLIFKLFVCYFKTTDKNPTYTQNGSFKYKNKNE